MSNLVIDGSVWVPGIYQIEEVDEVIGGPAGISNKQAIALGGQVAWLKSKALCFNDVNPVMGTYGISVADIGKLVSVHAPVSTVLNLPALAGFPVGSAISIVVNETGDGSVVPLNGNGTDVIEEYLNVGGVSAYSLMQGTRIILIATVTSWIVVLKTMPAVITSGFMPGDAKFTASPASYLQSGFLLGVGQLVSRVVYADLFAAIGVIYGAGDGETTFQLPDYRGVFPRITNGVGGFDGGRTFGTLQMDAIKDHRHNTRVSTGSSGGTVLEASTGAPGEDDTGYPTLGMVAPDGGYTETRPINQTFTGWIKY